MGWLGRKHGLQANSVTAIELVTADGRTRRVDAEHEPELFWALRGGNGNFGVVTAIEFAVYPVSSYISHWRDEFVAHIQQGRCPYGGQSSIEGILAPSEQHHGPAHVERPLAVIA